MVSFLVSCTLSARFANTPRYHYKCLKIARGKVKEDDKYTCPICDWRMKIPRDASRPKIEELMSLQDEIANLPFQPEEEDILANIIDNAQTFRDRIARYCNPVLSTKAEAETQRFYLRKLEGAEVLLAYEINFFRQELHKWCPVAPEAPPILEVSRSTRKPRPTKLQKMLVEYGVDNPDDLPEHAKGKANSLRRKAANAEAAALAAQSSHGPLLPPSADGSYGPALVADESRAEDDDSHLGGVLDDSHIDDDSRHDVDSIMHDSGIGSGPRLHVNHTNLTFEERLLQGDEDLDLHSVAGKAKALEILDRTADGRKQAERIYGADVWDIAKGVKSNREETAEPVSTTDDKDDTKTDQIFKDMTNQDEDVPNKSADGAEENAVTTESLEHERNDLDAMIDGE